MGFRYYVRVGAAEQRCAADGDGRNESLHVIVLAERRVNVSHYCLGVYLNQPQRSMLACIGQPARIEGEIDA